MAVCILFIGDWTGQTALGKKKLWLGSERIAVVPVVEFFLLQALHGIKPGRVTSTVAVLQARVVQGASEA